jgi:uncharacterized protein YciI
MIGAVVVLAFAMPGAEQASAENAAAAPPGYDADLARELGADEHGMRNYVLVILRTGPNDGSIDGKEREEVFKGHFANMERLAGEGKLVLAGPFGRNDKALRGLFVFAVSTVEEARALAETDPAVRAGVFTPEYMPWYGSAALMQVNSVHKRIAAQDI